MGYTHRFYGQILCSPFLFADSSFMNMDGLFESDDVTGVSLAAQFASVSESTQSLLVDMDTDGWGAAVFVDPAPDLIDLVPGEPLPADWCSEDGFIKGSWISAQTDIEALLFKHGLSGERLALQAGDEIPLLSQLYAELLIEPSIEQQSFHLLQLRRLTFFAEESVPRLKRFRGEYATAPLQRLRDALTVATSERLNPSSSSTGWPPVTVILPPKGQRRTRQLLALFPGLSKVDSETRQKQHWLEVIFRILEAGKVPLFSIAASACDPAVIISGAAGATRAGTLSAYTRSFQTFLSFLFQSKGKLWPHAVVDILEYLHVRCSEPCSASVPQVFLQALAWFEKTASIPRTEKFSGMDLVLKTVDYVIETVSQNSSPLRQAARLPACVLVALELYVCREGLAPGKALKGFTMLCKSYCTLREDDIQHAPPSQLRVMGELVVCELLRTKTTGKTKRVKELPVALWAGASVTSSMWIETGLHLCSTFGDVDRDHILPRLSSDGMTAIGGPMTYSASAGFSRKVLGELRRPIFIDGKWSESDKPLLHSQLVGFWTEHGPRSVMPSLLAQLKVEQTRADFLGRWSPSGSADYTRTFRTVVKELQQIAIIAVRSGNPNLDESDILDRLRRFCIDHDMEAQYDDIKSSLVAEMFSFSQVLLQQDYKEWLLENPLEATVHQQLIARPKIEVVRNRVSVSRSKRYLLVYSKGKRFARLHRLDEASCHWVKVQLLDCIELDDVDASMYNARCKVCWPRQAPSSEETESSDSGGSDID